MYCCNPLWATCFCGKYGLNEPEFIGLDSSEKTRVLFYNRFMLFCQGLSSRQHILCMRPLLARLGQLQRPAVLMQKVDIDPRCKYNVLIMSKIDLGFKTWHICILYRALRNVT